MKAIRRATAEDMDVILAIYDSARSFMREVGNASQWTGGYPSREMISANIEKGALYLCVEDGALLGVFYYAVEDDPTYRSIYGGEWQNDLPYAVIHRIAVSPEARGRGVAGFIFDACYQKHPNIRIDTHRDNIPMQRALAKSGFKPCGIIYLLNGEQRIAYQRC